MPFVWKQRGIQTQSAQLWQGDAGGQYVPSKERQRERGDWGEAEEWGKKKLVSDRKAVNFFSRPTLPLYSNNTGAWMTKLLMLQ